MSDQLQSFVQLALRGEVMLDEVDDYVEQWHSGDNATTLREFLGLSAEEYSLWLDDPSFMGMIVAARGNEQPIREVINDNYADLSKLAARSDASTKIKRLKVWVEEQERLALGDG